MKKAIFFLRHNNDIDHIVPVIWKLSKTTDVFADVVVVTDSLLLGDPRLKFVAAQDNTRVRSLGSVMGSQRDYLQKTVHSLESDLRQLFGRRPRVIYPDQTAIESVISKLLEGVSSAVACFDWVLTSNRRYLDFVQHVKSAMARRGLRTVALPHGDSPYHSRLVKVDEIDFGFEQTYVSGALFDAIAVPNELCARRYRNHVEPQKLKILGSPRYNREWLSVMPRALPDPGIEIGQGCRKVVLFLRNNLYAIWWDEVVRSIDLIAQQEALHLIVKHHTRDAGMKRLLRDYPNLKRSPHRNVTIAFDEISSDALLNWADLVLDLGTTVVFEPIMKDNAIAALEHLHAGRSTVGHYLPSVSTSCRDDLFDLVQNIDGEGPKALPEEKNRFVSEVIEVVGPNVLEHYTRMIQENL